MRTFNYILSVGLAAAAGVAFGILTAPRSGKKTRTQLLNDFEETKKSINEAADKKLSEAKKLLNESVREQIENGKALLSKADKELVK